MHTNKNYRIARKAWRVFNYVFPISAKKSNISFTKIDFNANLKLRKFSASTWMALLDEDVNLSGISVYNVKVIKLFYYNLMILHYKVCWIWK